MRLWQVLSLLVVLAPSVAFAQIFSAEIPHTKTPPVIDGIPDDVWEGVPEYSDFRTVNGTVTGPDDLFVVWKGLWDENNLYVQVDVVDDVVNVVEVGDWQNDSVEVYTDTLLEGFIADAQGTATLDYGPGHGPNELAVYQLTMHPGQSELHEGINHLKYIELAGGSPELDGAWIVDSTFYSLEIAYSWESLGTDIDEIAGQGYTIGFGLAVNDDDETVGSRAGQLMWASDSPDLWRDATEFPLVSLLPPDPSGPLCDFDGDGICDSVDIDLLGNEIIAGTHNPDFDLNGDAAVNLADQDQWRSDAATENGFGAPYLPGDADLSGDVGAPDLNALALSWNTVPVDPWSDGDFNADGNVNAQDLNLLALSWQQSIPVAAAASVPEPALPCWLVLGLVCLLRRARQRRS